MRIVVTGGTGNIGWRLLHRLAAEGRHNLVGIARRLPSGPAASFATWRSIDLSTDECRIPLAAAFRDADVVIHLAWGFQPSHRQDYLGELDVGGTRRTLAAAAEAGVLHLVHQSSLGAYAPKRDNTPVDESWPTTGVPTSGYSRRKAAAERLLDDYEAAQPETLVTRVRPGIVGQREAASSLLRYTVPGVVPARLLGALPVLPLDRDLAFSAVHVDDYVEAVAAMLHQRVGGAFNLAAPTPVTAEVLAAVLGARHVHVPAQALRAALWTAWQARLYQVDPGWLDMAMALPLLDAGRARRELGWVPAVDGPEVMAQVVDGMRHAASAPTPVLRPRAVTGALRDAWRRGPVATRRFP